MSGTRSRSAAQRARRVSGHFRRRIAAGRARWTRAFIGAALAAVALASLPGCNRKPHLVPAEADSTGHGVDSATVRVRHLQELWEAGGSGEEAAALSARVLFERLGNRPPEEWKERADALLDSLGIGFESAAGAGALAINLFPRSDPTSGSWPYLFWRGEKRSFHQPIEGRNLRLVNLVARGLIGAGRAAGGGSASAAVLFARRAGGGQQPILMVWEAPPASPRWSLVQTLGPDSLGGVGTGEFETPSDTTVELITRTYRTPPFFEECATCPHLFRFHRFRWALSGFERVEDNVVPSTYSSFVQFIQALMVNDRDAAEALVSDLSLFDMARKLDWGKPRGTWRVAPATDETPQRITFFRGDREAYRVEFQARGDAWVIAGIEEVPRSVE